MSTFFEKQNFKERLLLNPIRFQTAFFIVIISMAVSVAIQLIWFLYPSAMQQELINSAADTKSNGFFLDLLLTGLISPLIEEILFRGLIFLKLRKIMPVFAAALVTAALFGVLHGNWGYAIIAGIISLYFTFLLLRYDSLFAPIIAHVATNVLSVILNHI